jgi:tRNA threonylcarbamoyladenosine biosynthesis protein TsaB
MLLAIDTATRWISLALHDGQEVTAEATWQAGSYHTVELAPQVALLMRRAGVAAAQLAGIAVAIGPGSYTGLRIGLGFAKGLSLAQAVPLVGVPTLDGLMRAQPPRAERAVALLQAGRGHVSAARYRWNAKHYRWESGGETQVLDWAGLVAQLAAPPAAGLTVNAPPDDPTAERAPAAGLTVNAPPAAGLIVNAPPVYVVGEIDAAGAEQLRALKGQVVLATPAQSLRRAGFLAELGWERLRVAPDDANRLAPNYGGPLVGAGPVAAANAAAPIQATAKPAMAAIAPHPAGAERDEKPS